MSDHWIAGTEENVIDYVRSRGKVAKALVDDEAQRPEGSLWKAIETLASEGKLVIENDTARLP